MSVNSVFAGRYKLLQRISVAAHIELWKAEDIKTTDIVSLKLCSADSDTFSHAQLLKEFMVLTQIRHPNLLTPLHYDDFESQPYLVFPYTEGYSLKQYHLNNPVLPESNARKLLLSGSKALMALHDSGILHRNIIPSNVFLLNGVFMLGPFKRQSETIHTPEFLPYLAPELINSEAEYSAKSDLFSLATIVYESCTHRLSQIHNDISKIKLPESYSESFQQLLSKCLSAKPELRPSLSEVIIALENSASPVIAEIPTASLNTIKEPAPPVAQKKVDTFVEALVVHSAEKNQNEHATPNQGDRKKVNRLVAALCVLVLFLAGFVQVVSSVNKTGNTEVVVNTDKPKTKIEIEQKVELPSAQLNINSLQPDTIDYSAISVDADSENITPPVLKDRQGRILQAFRNEDGTYGFKDANHNTVIMPVFEDVFEFSEGLAAVKMNGLWGYIDMNGNWVINAKYHKPGVFSEGRAKVEENGNVMFINKTGTCVGGCIVISHLN